MSSQAEADLTLAERLRGQRERHIKRPMVVRVAFVVAGFTVLLAGLAMVIFPGPALAVIPAGLAILALEFCWAERALGTALEQAEKAKRSASETTPRQRILFAVALACAAAAAVAAVLVWDIPLLPV